MFSLQIQIRDKTYLLHLNLDLAEKQSFVICAYAKADRGNKIGSQR